MMFLKVIALKIRFSFDLYENLVHIACYDLSLMICVSLMFDDTLPCASLILK